MPSSSPRGRVRSYAGRAQPPPGARRARGRGRRSLRGSAPLRLRTGFVFIAVVLSFFGARLVQLQGVEPGEVRHAGGLDRRHRHRRAARPTRGQILDRNGRPLADSVDGRMVVADPCRRRKTAPDAGAVPGQAAARRLLHDPARADPEELAASPTSPGGCRPRWRSASSTRRPTPGYKGLATRNDPVRSYPDHDVAANLVGFMGTDGPLAGPRADLQQAAGGHRRLGDLRGRRRQPHPARPQHGRRRPSTAPTCTPPSTRTCSGTPSGCCGRPCSGPGATPASRWCMDSPHRRDPLAGRLPDVRRDQPAGLARRRTATRWR